MKDHTGRALDGDEEMATHQFPRHLWQVVDDHMEKLGCLEALMTRPAFPGQYRPQLAHAVPIKTDRDPNGKRPDTGYPLVSASR